MDTGFCHHGNCVQEGVVKEGAYVSYTQLVVKVTEEGGGGVELRNHVLVSGIHQLLYVVIGDRTVVSVQVPVNVIHIGLVRVRYRCLQEII